MQELQLIQQIKEGNKNAFEELYYMFKDVVYNTAICYLQSAEDAEELTQDVFLTIFQKAYTFKGNSTVSTWIYKITINKSLNYKDKNNRRPSNNFLIKDDLRIDFRHPGIILENQEKGAYLFSAINSLIDSQKTAFILIYMEGLSQQEVALIMEITEKSVESLLQRAKVNLRKKLLLIYPEGK